MQLNLCMRHPKNMIKELVPVPFTVEGEPKTLRELITALVISSVTAYEERFVSLEEAKNPTPLTEGQMETMREIGKFSFDIPLASGSPVDREQAIRTALLAVEDGLVRVMQNGVPRRALDEAITVTENDVFTLVRLTMLSGRMW